MAFVNEALDQEQLVQVVVRTIIRQMYEQPLPGAGRKLLVQIGVSARHVHLSPEHKDALFGPEYSLTPIRELLQPGHYAAKEGVTLVGTRGVLQNVRILGPLREKTQVEISRSDAYALGLEPPIRESGKLSGSAGIVLIGPSQAIKLDEGVIVAKRHIHMPTDMAYIWGIKDGDEVSVRSEGERPVIFHSVLVRVNDSYLPEMHLDTDEANAAGLKNGDFVDVGVTREA